MRTYIVATPTHRRSNETVLFDCVEYEDYSYLDEPTGR